MTIFLVGYAGSGKSSMGRRLARSLELPFVDTDQRVEQSEGASIADIFYYQGEEYFRRAERCAIEDVVRNEGGSIVATGGGLPVYGDNMEWMTSQGVTIYLKRSAENILSRLTAYGREKRPMFRGKSDEELILFMREQMALREPYYMRADIVVDCSLKSDADAVEYIVKKLKELK